jgi:hypothetical protein
VECNVMCGDAEILGPDAMQYFIYFGWIPPFRIIHCNWISPWWLRDRQTDVCFIYHPLHADE